MSKKGSEKINNAHYSQKFGRTICEVHRELYDVLFEEMKGNKKYEPVLEMLEEAYGMAKKMDAKLRQYKHNYDDNWWEKERKEVVQEKLRTRKDREKKK